MSLTEVQISNDAWEVCLIHALTTEKEEVMGLLLGDIETIQQTGGSRAVIIGVSVLTRSDKRKDRVEISPEQLTAAAADAEKITEQLGKRTRVIGWYHSHPHITVLPSHVDIQTQALYQLLDPGFIGLIFSCFNKDPANTSGRIQVTAFQSIDLSKISENGNSLKSSAPSISLRKSASNVEVINVDDSPAHIIPGLGAERVEVTLQVISAPSKGPSNLEKVALLQDILYKEENVAYLNSLKPNPGETSTHPLIHLHSAAVYQKALYRLLELETLPALYRLQQRHKENVQRIKELKEQKRRLEQTTKKAKN